MWTASMTLIFSTTLLIKSRAATCILDEWRIIALYSRTCKKSIKIFVVINVKVGKGNYWRNNNGATCHMQMFNAKSCGIIQNIKKPFKINKQSLFKLYGKSESERILLMPSSVRRKLRGNRLHLLKRPIVSTYWNNKILVPHLKWLKI